jgi:hypothetical protein
MDTTYGDPMPVAAPSPASSKVSKDEPIWAGRIQKHPKTSKEVSENSGTP